MERNEKNTMALIKKLLKKYKSREFIAAHAKITGSYVYMLEKGGAVPGDLLFDKLVSLLKN